MVKQYAKYMRYGKVVRCSWTAWDYKLIEDMDAEKATVKAVLLDNYERYRLLGIWIENWNKDSGFRERFTENIDACIKEREAYVEELRISDVTPVNEIRFITPHYDTKFVVNDLGRVKVNGKTQKVYYIDEYHFGFVDGAVYHICEFAELCEKNGIDINPVMRNTVLEQLA